MESQKKTGLQNALIAGLCATLCCALWGSASPVIKTGYVLFAINTADTPSIILFAGLRFFLAGVLATLIGSALNRKPLIPARASLPNVAKLALVQTILQYVFFYTGVANSSGVKSSIVQSASPFIVILVACFLFRNERFTVVKLAGCVFGLIGMVIVNLDGSTLDFNMTFLGEGCILISNFWYAISSSLIKSYSKTENPVTLSGYQFMLGGAIMAVIGFVLGGRLTQITWTGVGILFYLAVLSAVAYSLWGMLLKVNPVSRIAVYGFMTPIFGVLFSALILGEVEQAFNLQTLSALILVCIGIFIVNKLSAKWESRTAADKA